MFSIFLLIQNRSMKRKIQHDAVNNQEDEDSSSYPICFLSDQTFDKKKSIENSVSHFFSETSSDKSELTGNQNIPETNQ